MMYVNLKDNLILNNNKVNVIGNYLIKKYLNILEKLDFTINCNYESYKNINFSLDFDFNNIKSSIIICEWYEELNLESQYMAFLEDTKNCYYARNIKIFMFITKDKFIKKIKSEYGSSNVLIVNVNELLNELGEENV